MISGRMKILIFNWRDIRNPEAGGAEVFTHEIAKRLVKRGDEVTLFTSKFDNCKKEEFVDGIRIIRAGGKYFVYQKAKEYYKNIFSKEGFDVVIDEINTKPFSTPKFVNNGEKIIALIHQLAREFWFYETPFPVNLIGYYILEKRWLKNYANIPTITVSNSTKKNLDDLGFKKIFIVHNGLNIKPLSEVPEKAEKPTIIYVGRMKKAKKPQDVIEAFKIVKKEIRDVQLWMVGDGYLRKKLETKAKDIRFFGYVDKRTKDELVKKAWVIAVPGVREGWGQVVTDANALGTPAVGYNIPGLRDSIKHGYNGLLVEDGNIEALANAVVYLLENDNLREELSRNAIEWAKRFSWDRSAEEFEKVIKNVIGER